MATHVWTIEVNGSSKNYDNIEFERNYNSPDPTEFSASIEYNSGIDYWQTVAIKNNGTVEWYGYIEKIQPSWTKDGLRLDISGRDRLVILWKKFTERFSETRMDGFFGAVDPSKLIYFMLRCPISSDPTTSNLSKIGWGIDPSNWATSASATALSKETEWTFLRKQGLAWQLGPKFNGTLKKISSFYAEKTNWQVPTGSRPDVLDDGNFFSTYIQSKYYTLLAYNATAGNNYVDVANAAEFSTTESVRISTHVDTGVHGGNHETKTIQSISIGGGAGGSDRIIFTSTLSNSYTVATAGGVLKRVSIIDSWYEMDDLGATDGVVTGAYVVVYGRHVRNSWGTAPYPSASVKIYVHNGTSWDSGQTVQWADGEYGYGGYATVMKTVTVTSALNTFAKINACKIKLEFSASDATQSMARISEIRLVVTGYATQGTGDYFTVDLGAEYDRVSGIYIESRKNTDRFARNYYIYTSQNGSSWTLRANKANNLARDIIESWSPVDDVRYIKIYIYSPASYAWEISQIYVYQSDTKKYCVLDEGSGTSPAQHIESINIGTTYIASYGALKPLNLPFGRLSENINSIVEKAHDNNYDTWEFWVDHADGKFNFAARKGSDKSATISFVTGTNLGDVGKEGDTRAAHSRVKVVGKGEGKNQDEITSDWKLNTTGESSMGSFYENVIVDKNIADKDTANVVANVDARRTGDVEETFEVKITNDTYNSMAYDVGDDVTVTDSLTGLSGSYRIRSIRKTITPDKGEEITLVIGTRWKDYSDEWAEIKRMMRSIAGSGTIIGDWTADGSNEGKIKATKVTDLWDKTAKNDDADAPADKTDSNWNVTGDGSWSQEQQCTENWFLIKGSKDSGGTQRTIEAFAYNDEGTGIQFRKNPKFAVTIKIVEDGTNPIIGATDWRDNDQCTITMSSTTGILGITADGFGFRIVMQDGQYKLYAILIDAGGQNVTLVEELADGTYIAIDTETKYDLEARVIWYDEDGNELDVKYVEYYFNGELIGILKFNSAEDGTGYIMPVAMNLITQNEVGYVNNWAQIYFYKWKSEWLKQ